jgi:cold shock CspA family protein
MRVTGTVKFFVEDKPDGEVKGTGFGFIAIDGDGNREAFVHRTQLGQSCIQATRQGAMRPTLNAGQRVCFALAEDQRGLKAERVELI